MKTINILIKKEHDLPFMHLQDGQFFIFEDELFQKIRQNLLPAGYMLTDEEEEKLPNPTIFHFDETDHLAILVLSQRGTVYVFHPHTIVASTSQLSQMQ